MITHSAMGMLDVRCRNSIVHCQKWFRSIIAVSDRLSTVLCHLTIPVPALLPRKQNRFAIVLIPRGDVYPRMPAKPAEVS
jgi:hypothetical protein